MVLSTERVFNFSYHVIVLKGSSFYFLKFQNLSYTRYFVANLIAKGFARFWHNDDNKVDAQNYESKIYQNHFDQLKYKTNNSLQNCHKFIYHAIVHCLSYHITLLVYCKKTSQNRYRNATVYK